jgi:hypothetical protein
VARHVEVPKKMFCAPRFLTTDEILLAAAVYVGAVAHDEMEYHLIWVEMQKGVAAYAGMLVDFETAEASCGPLENDEMEENPYHRHRRHHHPFCH